MSGTGLRPDPLAPPEGYGARPAGLDSGVPLGVCAFYADPGHPERGHCPGQVAEIWTFGCEAAEHAGPVPFCAGHAVFMASRHISDARSFTCMQCDDRAVMRLLRRADLAGRELPLPGLGVLAGSGRFA